MNNGKSIVELAEELQRRNTEKRDFVLNTHDISVNDNLNLQLSSVNDELTINPIAHKQLAAWADIPNRYYEKLQNGSAKDKRLLADNVNHWFTSKKNNKRMVRTLDNTARAFLSNRYRRIDNEQIAEYALPTLLESNDIKIVSTDITDSRMYIKALYPRIEADVKVGDPVQAGLVISNSEVGQGSLMVQPLIYRLICTNGMISAVNSDFGLKRHHVGRAIACDTQALYRSATIAADDKALMMKLQDVIRAASNPAFFTGVIEKMRAAANTEKVVSPVHGVQELAKAFNFSEGERNSILENLIRERDYSKWGMLNAVTEVANTNNSYERSTELEITGGKILELSPTQWHRIAQAA